MLESMRRQGASIFIYLIFGLLIVIFVINFGPQGGGERRWLRGTSNVVVSVDGEDVDADRLSHRVLEPVQPRQRQAEDVTSRSRC